MLGERNTPEELLTAFHHDAEWWKSTVGYIENEIEFVNRLLNAHVFKENTPNLFEHLQQFKHVMGTKTRETSNLKKEILEYEDKLRGILECQDVACDTYYLENHKALKERFEDFYIGFNDYKTKVFDYLGAILLTK
ncbi:hypothetical protein [Maribacter sp. ACAM166]|uniref:hypothetical protein n=1 Tax=Maribacter sp. ACAM166 TaxID=2508996 RepID=UPI0010FE1F22|nr:hypothetical protein [Maribacter sp. ACAM166]TLP81804.1 hypothetical protein ES765_03755 [Maribacter sp. ACAM166]